MMKGKRKENINYGESPSFFMFVGDKNFQFVLSTRFLVNNLFEFL